MKINLTNDPLSSLVQDSEEKKTTSEAKSALSPIAQEKIFEPINQLHFADDSSVNLYHSCKIIFLIIIDKNICLIIFFINIK